MVEYLGEKATYDIAQSSIEALTLEEIMAFSGKTSIDFLKRVAQQHFRLWLDRRIGSIQRTRRFIIPTHDTSEYFTDKRSYRSKFPGTIRFDRKRGSCWSPCGQRISNSMICQKHLGQK